jgi:glutamine amidotransferase PdxT
VLTALVGESLLDEIRRVVGVLLLEGEVDEHGFAYDGLARDEAPTSRQAQVNSSWSPHLCLIPGGKPQFLLSTTMDRFLRHSNEILKQVAESDRWPEFICKM